MALCQAIIHNILSNRPKQIKIPCEMLSVGRWISNNSIENNSFNGNSVDIQVSMNRQASVFAVVMVLWSVAQSINLSARTCQNVLFRQTILFNDTTECKSTKKTRKTRKASNWKKWCEALGFLSFEKRFACFVESMVY